MKYLIRRHTLYIFFPILCLISTNVTANQIPIDIVEALISRSTKSTLVLGKEGVNFPILDLGSDIILYGNSSTDKLGRKSVTNLYTSSINKIVLENKIKELLIKNDWRIPEHFKGRVNTGFKSKSTQERYQSMLPYCHKAHGNIHLSIVTIKVGHLVKLSYSPHKKQSMKCEWRRPRKSNYMNEIEELPMPSLELPEQQTTSNNHLSGSSGGSSSSGQRSTEIIMTTDISIGDIYQHFVPQLLHQGWSQDSNWIGSTTAGGHWLSEKNDKHYLVGLSIINIDENRTSIQMWIRKQGQNNIIGIKAIPY